MNPAGKIMRRIEALAGISDESGKITRLFASPAMRRANALVASWMREAGMTVRVDAVGNLIGHYAGARPDAKILLLGSHLDTVRNAGKFDGSLGVILAIACVESLHQGNIRPPFSIEVAGFADEEGVRYQTAFLGSKALAGCFDQTDLSRQDDDGISLADAVKNFGGNPARLRSAAMASDKLLGYVEVHIEQGPVLEQKNLPVGIVSAIAGQTRARVVFLGRAGHAGTTPMKSRQDALCAAAEFILAVENLARTTPGLVATIGEISVKSGAANVIPGEVCLSLDVRHASDSVRMSARRALDRMARKFARRCKIQFRFQTVQETAAVTCSPKLSALLAQAVQSQRKKILRIPSGAGHDAVVMSKIAPAAMLFIRCRQGVSHHPDESVKVGDVAIALDVVNSFLQLLAEKYRQTDRQSAKTLL